MTANAGSKKISRVTNVCLPALSLMVVLGACSQSPLGLSWRDGSAMNTNSVGAEGLANPYQTQALAIIQTNCISCHKAGSGPDNVFNLTDRNHLVSARLVVPGKPDQSILFTEIQSGAMPPKKTLAAADQQVIENWITSASGTPDAQKPRPSPPPADLDLQPTFKSLQAKVFEPLCVKCHSSQTKDPKGPDGGYAFDTYAGVLKSVNIVNPTLSLVYKFTKNKKMPRKKDPLNDIQEAALLLWLNNGAQDN